MFEEKITFNPESYPHGTTQQMRSHNQKFLDSSNKNRGKGFKNGIKIIMLFTNNFN